MSWQRPGPGRPKGLKNKRTAMVEIIASKFNMDPFEVLMNFAAGNWKELGYDSEVYVMENAQGGTKIGYTIPPELRVSAAKECVAYLHSKKKETPDEQPDEIEVLSLDEKQEFLEQAEKQIEALRTEIAEARKNEIKQID